MRYTDDGNAVLRLRIATCNFDDGWSVYFSVEEYSGVMKHRQLQTNIIQPANMLAAPVL
jgi:hypothetical protein